MKRFITVLCILLSLAAVAATNRVKRVRTARKLATPALKLSGGFEQYRLLANQARSYRSEAKSDPNTVPGHIIHWYSDGTVVTNAIKTINAVVLTNTVEQAMEKLKDDVSDLTERCHELDAKVLEWAQKYAENTNRTERVKNYFYEKSQTGTVVQKAIWAEVYKYYTNAIYKIENM